MNSSAMAAPPPKAPLAPARPAFNWIDFIAIPVASCIMETQPIACFLLFWSLFLTSAEGSGFFNVTANSPQIEPWALNSITITLLLLWLHWWTMLTRENLPERWNQLQKQFVQLLGPVLAILAMIFVVDLSDLIGVGIFILLFWRISIFLTEREYRDERLIAAFRVGIITLVVILVFSYLVQLPSIMQTALASSLPIFFFSGLIALSFTRLSIINQENARLPGASQSNATRNWFFILSALWGFVVMFSLLLETYTFSFFEAVMQPIFYIFGLLIYAILYILFSIASLLLSLLGTPRTVKLPKQPSPPSALPHAAHASAATPYFGLLHWLFIVIVLILLLVVIVAILRSIVTTRRREVEEDEIRENLSLREVLAVRQPHPQAQEQPNLLEELDPESARARYRELLQMIATSHTQLARREHETPLEYERRINKSLRSEESASQLHELTKAYQQERYAGTGPQRAATSDFKAWLERFISQLRR